jgi:hypothetical protein
VRGSGRPVEEPRERPHVRRRPGRGHRFYEELGPLTRNGAPDRETVAALFEKYEMSLLGPPLAAD